MPCDTMAYPPPTLLPRPPPEYSLFPPGGSNGLNHGHHQPFGFPGGLPLGGLGPTNSFATPATGLPGLCAPGLGTPVSSGFPGFYSGRFPPFPFGGGLRPPMPPEDDNVKVNIC